MTRSLAGLAALALLGVLVLPLVALVVGTSPSQLQQGLASPAFVPALALSLRTTFVSVVLLVLAGTPLAWWLAHGRGRWRRVVAGVVDLPIVVPPAVTGVALLRLLGRRGLLGDALDSLGIVIPFSTSAVVLAQVVVAAPFFVQGATTAFRRVEPDLIVVARTLGCTPMSALRRVALPIAMPGLVGAACVAWARALGEFGATLLFAGNLPGVTQTMPLAIVRGLEADVQVAVAFSLALVAAGAVLLLGMRWATARMTEHR
ncbi:MAG: molybdate ABC transporter permease subunit [Myxococcota bacterium]